MKRIPFLIIGAGPSGLGAAYRLKELGIHDYLILERESWVGGLASSFLDDKGFTWDIGGHVQFSHYKYFDEAMDFAIPAKEWLHHERESWVWIKNRFIPYPFQNNIGFLPKDSMWECLKGIIEITRNPLESKPANFREWILASFGQGVADEFMLPYNFKVWAYPPEEMSYLWIGERVATINLERILQNILFERMDASWGPNNTFRFPPKGGTGAIWRAIAEHVGMSKIRLGSNVTRILAKDRAVELSDGSRIEYEHLLSGMPLDLFTGLVKESPKALVKRAQALKHSSSNIIGVGIKGKPIDLLKTKCWMYFPESSCPFYRMTVFSNYSPKNVPDISTHYSLMCEVSESSKKPVDRKKVVDDTVRGLKENRLLNSGDEIVSRWLYSAEYGYPTPSVDRDDILQEVIPFLDGLGAYSRGRFGGWKYEVSNQDHTFMQGVEWVNRITRNEPEETFRVDTSRDPNITILKSS